MTDAPPPERRPALPELLGARIERVDIPQRNLLALTLYREREKVVLLVWFGEGRVDVALSPTRPLGDPASAFTRRLRVAFEHARIDRAEWLGVSEQRALALRLEFTRSDARSVLVADFDARHPNLFLLDANERIVGAAFERAGRERFGARPWMHTPGSGRGVALADSRAELLGRGGALLTREAESAEQSTRRELAKTARAQRRKVARREQAVAGDVARSAEVPRLREEANLILCHLALIPRGLSEVELRDDTLDPPTFRTLKLDSTRDAQRNAEARFDRARKIERGMKIAEARLSEARAELATLDALLAAVDGTPLVELAELAQAAQIPMRSPQVARAARASTPAHVAYRTFHSGNGRPILVGKGGVDNDTLTLTVARPFDLWLHARSIQGAHVIIPCTKGTPAPAEQVLDAAHLAAHFSDGRSEGTLEIQMAERRHVRKPKGTPPGLVLVDRERVIVLRVERERVQRLLASERKPG